MAFEVKILKKSESKQGIVLTTWQLKYPRFIHAEFMTHREFSRNASSSRAIPVRKMIEQVRLDPATPIHWGANQPGMQADNQLDPVKLAIAKDQWHEAAWNAANVAEAMDYNGLHKQVANRVLEPFQWMHVVMSTTSLTNFFGLRCHPDAQPEIKLLAEMMEAEYKQVDSVLLAPGEWHLPYINLIDWEEATAFCQVGRTTRDMPSHEEVVEVLKKMSAARCARVSYLTHEGRKPTIEADLELFDRLVGARPLHASPTEHQATPDVKVQSRIAEHVWDSPELHGNFNGWVQHRKLLAGEYIR